MCALVENHCAPSQCTLSHPHGEDGNNCNVGLDGDLPLVGGMSNQQGPLARGLAGIAQIAQEILAFDLAMDNTKRFQRTILLADTAKV